MRLVQCMYVRFALFIGWLPGGIDGLWASSGLSYVGRPSERILRS